MGIFIEDLLHFGNLINNEIEVILSSEDFKKAFMNLDFEFTDGVMKIKGKKRILFLSKAFEFRGKEETNKVYNSRKDEKLSDFGIYLKILSPDGLDILGKDRRFQEEGEYLKFSIFDVFKNSEIYQKIPKQFRDKLKLTKYKIKRNGLSIFLTVG
ncbi:MAG TPA: hypothetical protein EYH58_07355 [Aquifex aeolicus]|nr:hypothetical protein [Aquifex aeolicus]